MTKSDQLYSRFTKIILKKFYKSGLSNLLFDKIYSRDAFNINCLSLSQMNRHRKEEV